MNKTISILNASVRVYEPATASCPFIIEADVTIFGDKASDIQNGHVRSVADGVETNVADFSSYSGVCNYSYFGEPDIDKQVAVLGAINDFNGRVRDDTYNIKSMEPSGEE